MKQNNILALAIMLAVLVSLTTACTEEAAPVKLKETLLCEGNEGVAPFKVNCKYFYLDDYNNEVEPTDTVYWTLDIALEGIAQRFYSQTTGNRFFTEIDRPGEYTLTAANSGNKTSIMVSIFDPRNAPSSQVRHVPVSVSSAKHEKQERILEATPGYEITRATVQVHPNSTRVSSRVVLSGDGTSAKLIVELQPKSATFKVVRAWFAGNVILTERKI
jgi:hypothetical protein